MTSPKLWQCHACKAVLPRAPGECPHCEMPDATYTGVDPDTFEWTPEAKKATHTYANDAVQSENFENCLSMLLYAVMRPLARGQKVDPILQRHYLNQLISVTAIGVYAEACGIPLEDLEVDDEHLQELVEDLMRRLGEEGYEGAATWRSPGDGYIVAELDSALPDQRERLIRAILGRLADDDEPLVVAGLRNGLREELARKAVEFGIEDVHAGEHEQYGSWVGNVDLEEALQGGP